VQAERRRLESAFEPVLRRKAQEWGYGEDAVESLQLKIEEPREENPMARDDFDAEEFSNFAQGLKRISGGNPQDVVEPDEVREMLGLPTEMPNRADSATSNPQGADELTGLDGLDETDEEVIAQFQELYGEPAVEDASATEMAPGDD
jgi:hypothetical protein